jgi:hypothetical protein
MVVSDHDLSSGVFKVSLIVHSGLADLLSGQQAVKLFIETAIFYLNALPSFSSVGG